MDVMIDLETWGIAPGAAVRSIGAIGFEMTSDALGDEFYANINTQSCMDVGLRIDKSTADWWAAQSPEARNALEDSPLALAVVAHRFYGWYAEHKFTTVWCHGATFDVPLWEVAVTAVHGRIPWGYRDARDTRTLFALAPGFRTDSITFEGEKHNALADARHQARLVQRAYRMIRDPLAYQ